MAILLDRVEAEGQGLPGDIATGFELQKPWMEFYLNAFTQLSSDRPAAGSPIPWTSIDRYASRYNVKGPDFDVFVDMIRMMDQHRFKKGQTDGQRT